MPISVEENIRLVGLIERVKAGRDAPPGAPTRLAAEAAYVELIETIDPLLGRLTHSFRRRTGLPLDDDYAADIWQDMRIRLWDRAHLWDARRGNLAAWVGAIVHNHAIDLRRRAAHRGEITFTLAFGDPPDNDGQPTEALHQHNEPTPEEVVMLLEREDLARTLLLRLRNEHPRHAEMIFSHIWKGQTHREISDTLGIPIGTVKSRLADAWAYLRQYIKEAAA